MRIWNRKWLLVIVKVHIFRKKIKTWISGCSTCIDNEGEIGIAFEEWKKTYTWKEIKRIVKICNWIEIRYNR